MAIQMAPWDPQGEADENEDREYRAVNIITIMTATEFVGYLSCLSKTLLRSPLVPLTYDCYTKPEEYFF